MVKNGLELKLLQKSIASTKLELFASQISCCLLAVLVSGDAIAVDLSVAGHGGLDTNPHKLSSSLDPEVEPYTIADIKLSNRFENDLFFKGRSRHAFYLDDDRGDWSRTELDFGYRSKFEYAEKKFNYELSADWTDRDKNYVSRTTGEDATSNGESIVDRYDYVSTNLNAEISFRTEQKTRYRLRFQRRDKDYEDFSITGLSDYDYSHDRYRFDVEFRVADKHRIRAEIGKIEREYDDRRNDDLNGDEIPNSDREYDYDEYLLGYIYRPDKELQIRLELSSSDRSDNGVGYNDSTYDRLYLSGSKQLNEREFIGISLTYSDFAYDNRNFSGDESQEEDTFDNDGYRLRFDYREKLRLNGEENLTLIYAIEVIDYDSSDPRYRFNRELISIGIKYKII